MERTILRTTLASQTATDLAYWRQRSMADRIAAVEVLRRDWESATTSAADAEPRLQRVCRVAQRRGRTTIDGVQFDDCWTRREQVTVDGVPLAIIGLADFAMNKRARGRLKDLADLESLGLAEPGAGSTDAPG